MNSPNNSDTPRTDDLQSCWRKSEETQTVDVFNLARTLERELNEMRKSKHELSDAYLRVRKLVNAFDTKPGGTDRFEVTENAIKQLRDDLKMCAEALKTVYNVLETCKNNKGFWGEVLFTDHVSPAINNPRIQAILNEK